MRDEEAAAKAVSIVQNVGCGCLLVVIAVAAFFFAAAWHLVTS